MKTLVFTGGHHTGALEVAKRLKERGWRIVWFGHKHSMWNDSSHSSEFKEVTEAGIEFHDLLAGKFHHTYNPLKLIRIPWGFIQALCLLLILKPNGIISFGGYLAVPTVIMGWILGIPSITHEQTITQGWANKLISRFVKRIAVTWPDNIKALGKKWVLVGLPLRKEILVVKKNILKKPLLFITGGKQGAVTINRVVFETLPELLKKYDVLHQVGNNTEYGDWETAQKINLEGYKCVEFLKSLEQAQALADAEIVIGRSGAHIIYELGYLGKKCVLIPIPWVSHNEQFLNAQKLARSGNAIILPQASLTKESLLKAIIEASVLKPKKLKLVTDATDRMVMLAEAEFGK